jgi:kynurenine formamidase
MLIDLTLHLPPDHPARSSLNQRDAALAQSGHFGTHLDRHGGSTIPLDYIKGRGILADITGVQGELTADMVSALPILPGDFVFFRTGELERLGYGTPEYNAAGPVFSWEALNIFTKARIRFVGVDIRGLRKGDEHNEADRICEAGGVFVIENLDKLSLLPIMAPFQVYTMWFEREGSGLPCRVVAELP